MNEIFGALAQFRRRVKQRASQDILSCLPLSTLERAGVTDRSTIDGEADNRVPHTKLFVVFLPVSYFEEVSFV